MHAPVRRYVTGCVALVGVSMLAFTPGMAGAEDAPQPTALLMGGKGQYATLTDEQMATALNGYFADYTRINVPLPGSDDFAYSVAEGTKALYAAVYATAGPKTIGSVSQGAPVVFNVLRLLASDPNPPPPAELNAIVYGAPSPIFYLLGPPYQPPPQTQYDLIIIKVEYDGVADFPDNPLNLLAVANAYMGGEQLHVPAAFSTDLSKIPAQDITVVTNSKGGTTTSYLVPTPRLPLLKPLVDQGVDPSTIAFLDAILRPIIDSAYFRIPPVQMTASTSISAPNKPPALAASTLTLNTSPAVNSVAPKTDSGPARPLSETTTQAQQTLDTAEAASATNGLAEAESHTSTQPQRGLVASVTGATHTTDGLTKALEKVPDEPNQGLTTARDAGSTEKPSGATDLTDGNMAKPGQGASPTHPTEHGTGIVQDVQQRVADKTSHADDGLINARTHVDNSTP